jgi:hypothetical protein
MVRHGRPSSHKMNLTSTTGEPMSAAAVMTEDGSGYFLATAMPALEEGKTTSCGDHGRQPDHLAGRAGQRPHVAAFQANGGSRPRGHRRCREGVLSNPPY